MEPKNDWSLDNLFVVILAIVVITVILSCQLDTVYGIELWELLLK